MKRISTKTVNMFYSLSEEIKNNPLFVTVRGKIVFGELLVCGEIRKTTISQLVSRR